MTSHSEPPEERRLTASPTPRRYPWWIPRIWIGCDFFVLATLIARNRFQIAPSRVHAAVIDLGVGLVTRVLGVIQTAILGRRIDGTKLSRSPVFVIGHWRTGTTLVHELLGLDTRHTFPTFYQCLVPTHFLISEGFARRWLAWILPRQRVMDGMTMGFDRPQEDEFALLNLGLPSPYRTIAFPNRLFRHRESWGLDDLSPGERERWRRGFEGFLKRLTFRDTRRLILKSPTHTFRIKHLVEMFPEARFVYMVRDPHVVFPSTVHMWKSLFQTQSFQLPHYGGLEEYVFETYLQMHRAFEEMKDLLRPEQLHQVRYEKLIADPIGEMEALYEALGLGEFDSVRPRLGEYLAELEGYETNIYPDDPLQGAEVSRRWADPIRQYGYEARFEEEGPAD